MKYVVFFTLSILFYYECAAQKESKQHSQACQTCKSIPLS